MSRLPIAILVIWDYGRYTFFVFIIFIYIHTIYAYNNSKLTLIKDISYPKFVISKIIFPIIAIVE